MQPGKSAVRLLVTGIVACVSFAGFSSSMPVPSASSKTVNRTAEAASVPSSSSPAPLSTTTSSRSTGGKANASASTSPGESSRISGAQSISSPPVTSSRSSFGLGFGHIDYAAADIARRVSRIFVHRRESAHETREEVPETATKAELEAEAAQEERGQKSNLIDTRREGSISLPPTLPLRRPSLDLDEVMDARACRWGCF